MVQAPRLISFATVSSIEGSSYPPFVLRTRRFCLPSFLPRNWSSNPSFFAKASMIAWSARDSNSGSITFSRHCRERLEAVRLRIRRMAPVDHRADVRILVDVLVLLHHAVDPARHRHSGLAHHARGE